MKDYKSLRGNPTLLTLLKAGARVELPDGSGMEGDPDTSYITTFLGGPIRGEGTGVRIMDHEGVALSLRDLVYDRQGEDES